MALLLGLPLLFVAVWLVCLIRGPRTGLLLSLLLCAATIATGYWAIMQSRASTAGVGILFLPSIGAVSGFLALAFARLRRHSILALRAAAWVCLAAAFGVAVSGVISGRHTAALNARRDQRVDGDRRAIAYARETIAAILRQQRWSRRRGARSRDHPASRRSEFSDRGVGDAVRHRRTARLAARTGRSCRFRGWNPRTRPDTLQKIYDRAAQAGSHLSALPTFQTLAAHKNTPPAILRAIADDPIFPKEFDRDFARNPSAPRDVLERVARSNDMYALRNLMRNDALDCELLRTAETSVKPFAESDFSTSDSHVAQLEARLCTAR